MTVKRGDIFYADLSPVVGSEQGGTRPVLIVQNDMGNRHSPTVIAAAITSQMNKAKLPTHIELTGRNVGLTKERLGAGRADRYRNGAAGWPVLYFYLQNFQACGTTAPHLLHI